MAIELMHTVPHPELRMCYRLGNENM